MQIDWFKIYVSLLLLILVALFSFREYRLTVAQDFEIIDKTANFCNTNNASDDDYLKCKDVAKKFLIIYR